MAVIKARLVETQAEEMMVVVDTVDALVGAMLAVAVLGVTAKLAVVMVAAKAQASRVEMRA
eukprot:7379455-Prymnesium_polylepis.1